MAFKTLFIAHSPDADKTKHRSLIDTGLYQLFSIVVKNQEEAVEVSKDFVRNKKIDAILLCPGFSHVDVAEIFKITKGNIAVYVARGDGPSSMVSLKARRREGFSK